MRKILLLIVSIAYVTACKKEKASEITPALCDSTISYTTKVKAIIDANCVRCHISGGSAPLALLNYQQVKAHVDDGHIKQRVIEAKTMPPDTTLSNDDIKIIDCWIQLGAPQ